MNIEKLGRNAIEKIKNTWGLPKTGFIAGGSISNLIWEEVSGNKAVINDIDVFVLDNDKLSNFIEDKENNLYSFCEKEPVWYESYIGIAFMQTNKDFYSITESTNDGVFNFVKYTSNTKNPMVILNSFDINCTVIGYSIDEDKLYWTKDFEDFLSCGELKVCNLKTPCHTAIRITKKSDELNVKLNDFEYKILQYVLTDGFIFNNPYKVRFQERYFDMYKKYENKLSEYFSCEMDKQCMESLKNRGIESNLWELKPKTSSSDVKSLFNSDLCYNISSNNILFYLRNISNNDELRKLWKDTYFFFDDLDYIDEKVSEEDLSLLGRVARYAPNSISNLKGLRLSEQINLIKKLFEAYKDDPIIAISILENHKLPSNIKIDEETSLILELSVRKEITNDYRDKVANICK